MRLLYRRKFPGSRLLARKLANYNSSNATIIRDVICLLLAFFTCFIVPLAVYLMDDVEREP